MSTWAGVAYGVMLALAVYDAFLFLYVRDRAHLYYAARVLSRSSATA